MKRLRERGFSLLELGIAMAVIALLLSSFLPLLSVRIEQADRQKTQELLEEIKEALYGYAITNGDLPCPDTDVPPDGLENCGAGTELEGVIPWAELGVTRLDAWGHFFRYRVTTEYTAAKDGDCNNAAPYGLDLCDTGSLIVRTRTAKSNTPSPDTPNLVSDAPAVIISHGKNGYGAMQQNGAIPAQSAPPDGSVRDESWNSTIDNEFYSRVYKDTETTCSDEDDAAIPYCEFDDLVIWISPFVLKNRMISAGKLP